MNAAKDMAGVLRQDRPSKAWLLRRLLVERCICCMRMIKLHRTWTEGARTEIKTHLCAACIIKYSVEDRPSVAMRAEYRIEAARTAIQNSQIKWPPAP